MKVPKAITDILLLKPAVSTRNLTSLLLVLAFFGVYVAAGGKIEAVPKPPRGTGFGTIDRGADSKAVVEPNKEKASTTRDLAAEAPRGGRTRDSVRQVESEQDSSRNLERYEREDVTEEQSDEEFSVDEETEGDELSDIERRLNLLSR